MCRKVSKYKEQNTILVSHQYILLNYLLNTILILNITIIIKEKLTGASITTFSLNGIVFIVIMMVKIFVSSYNPQITKARVNNFNLYKSNITLNSGLSMRVGISEAIRMLFFFSLKLLFILFLILRLPMQNKIQLCRQNKALNLIKVLLTYAYNNLNKMMLFLYIYQISAESEDVKFKPDLDNLKPLIADYNQINNIKKEDKKFNQWLAGLIDGDGCFLLYILKKVMLA